MTEFEELALKKITKDYLVDCIYGKINEISARYGISNADISKRIGWDPAGFNQKYNRSNDLRITTFVKIYVALIDLIKEKEVEMDMNGLGLSEIRIDELITDREVAVGALYNHISAVAEGNARFLPDEAMRDTYKRMRPFVLLGKRSKKYDDREVEVYVSFYKLVAQMR